MLIQSGSGTTTLGGAADNPFSGAIVNGGTLVLGKASSSSVHAIGANNNLNLVINGGTVQLAGTGGDQIYTQVDVQMNGGTFDLNGTSEGFDVLTGAGGIVTNTNAAASTLTLGENNSTVNLVSPIAYNTTYGGVIQNGAGTVAVTKSGTGLQTLSGANTYSGATTIGAGVLSVTGSTFSGGAVAVNSGGTLSGTGSVGNVTLNTGGAIRPGATNLDPSTGTLTMSSLSVTGGDIRLNVGASSDLINVTGTANFTAASTLTPTFSAPPVVGSVTLINATGGLTVGVAPTLTATPATTRSTFALTPTSNALSLTIGGASAKSLTWTGATSGAWDLNTTANFNSGGAEKFFNLDAVTFGDGPTNRAITLAAGLAPTTVTVSNSAGNDYTFQTGTLTAPGTSLLKTGNGTLFLNTANTFSGPVTITGGTIKAGNAAALGDANGQTFVSGGGTLDVNGQNLGAEVVNISGTGLGGNGALINTGAGQTQALRFVTLTGDATVGGNGRFDIRTNGGNETLDLAGFTLTKTGVNQFSLTGVSSVTNGNIVVNQGLFSIETTSVVQGSGTITYNPGTTAQFYQTVAANVTRPMVWNGNFVETSAQNSGVASNITLAGDTTFVATGNTLTLNGNLVETGGPRSIIKNNGGTLTLNGNNTFTGGITSTGGTINLTGTNTVAGPVSLTTSALQVLSTTTTNATLGNAASIALNSSTLRLNLLNNYTLPATTIGGVNLNSVITFSGQTQAATLTINSPIGTASTFLGSFNIEQGTATLASGANITANGFTVGQTALATGNVGTLNVMPGAALTAAFLYIGEGAAGRAGIVNQSGGTVTITGGDLGNDGSLRIGHWSGTGSTYNLSNGTLNVPNATTSIGVDGIDPSLNISGGTAVFYRLLVDGRLNNTQPIGGTLNLSGGELSIGPGGITNGGAGQTNLSGGTLSAFASSTWAVGMNLINNSPTLDTRGNVVTLSGALFGAGGFTKAGNGQLTLTNVASPLRGTINVNAGAAYLTGSLTSPSAIVNVNNGGALLLDGTFGNTGVINGTVNVNNGGLLSGSGDGFGTGKAATVVVAAGGEVRPGLSVGTLLADAFTMNGGVLRFDLNPLDPTPGSGANDFVAVTNALTFTGGTIIPSFSSAPISGNVYELFTSTVRTGLPTVDANAAVSRLNYVVGSDGTNVTLAVTGTAKALTWTGANGSTWNLNTTANFAAPAAEKFFQQDAVTFSGAAPGTITLAGVLQPSSTTVDASADYTFSGAGSIDSGSLTKTGTGTLTLTNLNNYAGGTFINGGTLAFSAGSLGRLGPITIGGGTLKWNGTNTQDISARLVMADATVSSLDTNGNTVVLGNAFGNNSSGALTKVGAGTLAFTGANTYTGTTTVAAGTLSIGNGGATGSISSGSPVFIAPGATMKWNNANASTFNVTISNQISGSGNLLLQSQNDVAGGIQIGVYDLAGNNSGFSGTVQINRSIFWNNLTPSEVGSGLIDVQDRGTMTFSGNNFTNPVTIEPGAGWHHSLGGDVVLGAIRLVGNNVLSGNIVLNNTASVVLGDNTGANSTIGSYNTSDSMLSGVISGPGDLAMSRYTSWNGGTQQAVLIHLTGSQSNTYTGKTVVDGQGSGTAQASLWLEKTGGAVAIAPNTVVQMGSGTGGQFNLRMGQNEQFGAGVVMNWVNASGQWGRFDLKGTTQTLAGINSGTLTVQGNGIVQNQGIDLVVPATDATLTLTGSGTYLYNGYLRDQDNSGTIRKIGLIKNGSGTQTLAGSVITYTGPTLLNNGTLALVDTTAYVSPTTINAGATLTTQRTVQGFASRSAMMGNALTLAGGTISINNDGAGLTGGWTTVGGAVGSLNGAGTININTGVFSRDNTQLNTINTTATVNVAAGAFFGAGRGGNSVIGALNGAGVVSTLWSGVNAGSITLGNGNGSGTFSGTLSGSGTNATDGTQEGGIFSLVKIGTGTQTLTGANTYSGGTTVNGGTLALDFSAAGAPAANILSSSTALTVGGGTLRITGKSGATNTQTFNGTTGAGTLQLAQNGAASLDVSLGAITSRGMNFSGATGLTPGARFVTTATAGSNDGTTRITGGALWNGTDWASINTVSGTKYVVQWAGTYTDAYNGTDSGSVVVPNTAAAELRINESTGGYASNTIAASSTTVNSLLMSAGGHAASIKMNANTANDTLVVGNGAAVTGDVAVGASAQALTIGTAPNEGVLTAGASGASTLNLITYNAASNLTVNSVIANNPGAGAVSVNVSGIAGGVVVFNGNSTYSGTMRIANTLQIAGSGSLGASNLYAGAITNTGTLQFSSSANQTLNGAITGTGGLIKDTNSGNTLTLSSTGTNYTGDTIINAGTLRLNLPSGFASTVTVNPGGTLALSGNNSNNGTSQTILNGGTLLTDENVGFFTNARTIKVTAPSTIRVQGTGTTGNVSQFFIDAGMSSTGAQTLTANFTTVSNGLVFRNSAGNFNGAFIANGQGQGPAQRENLNMADGTTMTFANTDLTLNNASWNIGLSASATNTAGNNFQVRSLNGNGFVVSESRANMLTVGNGNGSGSFSGIIANGTGGSLTFTKVGTGTQTLSGTNTYDGVTTINGGVLSVSTINNGGVAGNLGQAANTPDKLVLNGGTLRYTGATASTDRNFTVGTNGAVLDASGAGAVTFSGTPTLTGTGPRTFTLTGTNTDGNTLQGAIPDLGTSVTTLVKSGAGAWLLTSFNTYSGTTTVSGGTLSLTGPSGSIPNSIAISIASGAEMDLAGGNNKLGSGLAPGSGSVAISGILNVTDATIQPLYASTWTLNNGGTITSSGPGDATYGAFYVANSRTISANGSGNTIGAQSFAIEGGQTLTLNTPLSADTLLVSSPLMDRVGSTGAGVTKTGAGTVTLTGLDPYTGATTITAGSLVVNGSIGGSATSVNGGTLTGSGTTGPATLTTGTIAPGNGPGILTTGDLAFNGGTLAVDLTGTTVGTGYDQLNVSGSVTFNGYVALTINLGAFDPLDNGSQSFTIVSNNLSDPIGFDFAGGKAFTYAGLPLNEGSHLFAGAQDFTISYAGGSNNNDVVLTAVPEPGAVLSLLGGFGLLLSLRRRRSA